MNFAVSSLAWVDVRCCPGNKGLQEHLIPFVFAGNIVLQHFFVIKTEMITRIFYLIYQKMFAIYIFI